MRYEQDLEILRMFVPKNEPSTPALTLRSAKTSKHPPKPALPDVLISLSAVSDAAAALEETVAEPSTEADADADAIALELVVVADAVSSSSSAAVVVSTAAAVVLA